VSDAAAAIVGGLEMAQELILAMKRAIFEATYGTAPQTRGVGSDQPWIRIPACDDVEHGLARRFD